MFPSVANSNLQLISLLNESSKSLNQLKTCIGSTHGTKYASKWTNKSKTLEKNSPTNEKVNSNKNAFSKCYYALGLNHLSSDWFKSIDVPNTKWVLDKRKSLKWNTSYVSTESFLKNKSYTLTESKRHKSFLCQYMLPKRSLFLKDCHHKYYSTMTYNLSRLESIANQQTSNPFAQAEYLKAVLHIDPEYVVRRYESGRFAINEEVKNCYTKALLLTDQLSVAEAQRRSQNFSLSSSNDTPAGTSDSPLHVIMDRKNDSKDRIYSFIRVAIFIAVLYYVVEHSFNPIHYKQDFQPDQVEQNVTFDDVQGCEEAKKELQEIIQFLKSPEKFEKMGATLPAGVLLIGPPGTGKTLLARAIAGEADVPFFFASGSEFEEMFVGIGASRLRTLFSRAKEHAPCIVFIDELDAIGGKRAPSDQQSMRMTLNQLLVELDGYKQTEGVIILGATNFPDVLDPALTRPGRFDTQVIVPLPDIRGRHDILKLYLKKSQCGPDVDAETLARGTPGFSGADLYNLVNQAALRAVILDSPVITMEHMEWARDKITMGPERKSAVIEEKNRTLVAYHEGGHAIVALYTPEALPVHKATVVPRGTALGYVMQLPEKDELSWSRKQLLAKMDVCMGGRIAEEMIFGEDGITTGASSDMKQATKIARAMVTQYGMSEKIGVMLINEQEDKLSADLQSSVEHEVKRLLEESYIRAKNILKTHSKEHKKLAEALLQYETLNSEEIQNVIKGVPLTAKRLDENISL